MGLGATTSADRTPILEFNYRYESLTEKIYCVSRPVQSTQKGKGRPHVEWPLFEKRNLRFRQFEGDNHRAR
jgi:hypothetical protein